MFGGTDPTKVSGNIQLFPTSTSTVASASDFWALDADMTYVILQTTMSLRVSMNLLNRLGSDHILSNMPIVMGKAWIYYFENFVWLFKDTGTSNFQLASDAFLRYKDATGATVDSATQFLKLTSDQFASLPDLIITVLGVSATHFGWNLII